MSRTGRRMHAAVWVVAVAVVGLAIVFALRFGRDPRIVESPLVGHKVPALSLPTLGNQSSVPLRHSRGAVTLVNFWAPWCSACRGEHSALEAAARDFGESRLRVVGVVYQDSTSSVRNFLDQFGHGFDVVTDPGGHAAIEFGIFGIPETFFVDARGRIAAKVTGPVNDRVIQDVVRSIERGEHPTSVRPGPVQSKPSG